jgi:hypothetical protein
MSRKIDLAKIAKSSTVEVRRSLRMYRKICFGTDHNVNRWASQFAAVEVHAAWERYSEKRVIAALNHNASVFLNENSVKGVTRISSGLASYIVRGGRNFFDFKSSADLIRIGNRLLGPLNNPFLRLTTQQRQYLDCLNAIRNFIVHRSDAADQSYRKSLRTLYRLRFVPDPPEFLNTIDKRSDSPARGDRRIVSFVQIVYDAIEQTAKP